LAANFSPMPRIAPPPFGRLMEGGVEKPGSDVPFPDWFAVFLEAVLTPPCLKAGSCMEIWAFVEDMPGHAVDSAALQAYRGNRVTTGL
jgi:hypothetical protein